MTRTTDQAIYRYTRHHYFLYLIGYFPLLPSVCLMLDLIVLSLLCLQLFYLCSKFKIVFFLFVSYPFNFVIILFDRLGWLKKLIKKITHK